MLLLLALCPNATAVMAVLCADNDIVGEKGGSCPLLLLDEADQERSPAIDQTFMFESEDPDRRKLDVRSTTKLVTGWR